MAIAFRSKSEAYATSSPLVINKPAGTVENDVLIASRMYYGDDDTSSPPSGWTLIDYASESTPETDTGHRLLVYRKVAGSSEPSTYSWAMGSDQVQSVAIACYSGVDTSAPINAFIVQYNGMSTSMTAASITTTVADTMLVFAGCAGQSAAFSATPPSGFTERVDYYADWRCQYIADKIQTSAGASGSQVATLSVSRNNWGALVALKPAGTAPNAPTLNTATAGNTQVALGWSAATGSPTGYKVRYGTTSGLGTTIDVGNVTSYTVTSLTNGTLYYFAVSAYNGAGDGSNSNQLTATPAVGAPSAPTLSTTTAGNAQVALTWTSVGSATSYKVKYGTSTGSYSTTLSVGNVTSYTVTGLGNGTTYYFAAVATNGSGDSGNSNELNATPQSSSTPNAPVFHSLVGTSAQLTASWSVVPNATGYKVKRGTSAGTYTTTVDAGNVTSYNITGLTNGTRYYVAIVAYNGVGDGGTSNELNAQPAATSYIKTKYNDISNGDILLFEQLFELEAMTAGTHTSPDSGKIYKSVTVNGVNGYEFAVTRNVDGTGKNTWAAGSGYVNTGQAGSGFIDQYSYASVTSRPFEFICDGTTQLDPMSVDFTVLNGAGSMMYFGVASLKWDGLHLNITTPAVYTSATIVYEYWNGSVWTTLTSTVSAVNASNVAVTADFKTASRHSVIFTPPVDWATGSVVGQAAYWIRIRVSAASGWTQNPKHGGGKWATRGKRQYGSTIAFMRRNSSTWNDISTRAAIGNLEGHYDYGTQIYGFAAGDVGSTWISADTQNGFRVMNANTTLGSWDITGAIKVGSTSGRWIGIDTTNGVTINNTSTTLAKWDTSGNITIGNSASANTYISGGVMRLRLGGTEVINFDANSGTAYFNSIVTISSTGEIRQGTGTVGSNFTGIRLFNSSGIGLIAGYNAGTVQWQAGTDGKLYAGANIVKLDVDGVSVGYTGSWNGVPANTSPSAIKFFTSGYDVGGSAGNYLLSAIKKTSWSQSTVTYQGLDVNVLAVYPPIGGGTATPVFTVSLNGSQCAVFGGANATFETGSIKSSSSITAAGAVYASNWVRTYGDTGWYSETYGGGLYMTDTTWVRTYNGKSIYTTGQVYADTIGIGASPANNNYDRLTIYGGIRLNSAWSGYQLEARDNSSQVWTTYATGNNWRVWQGQDLIRFDTSGNASKLSAGTAWTSFSDARVKNVSGEYVGGLAEVLRIRPVVYDYNGKGGTIPNGRRNAGVLAQEIREIFPESVSEDRDTGLLMFDSTEITWALVNAVKELSAQIKELKQ